MSAPGSPPGSHPGSQRVVVRMLDAGPRRVERWQAALDRGPVPAIVVPETVEFHGADVVVTVDRGVRPPRWPWLARLLDALDASDADAVQVPIVGEDHTVVAPFLVGHPVSSLDPLAGRELPARSAGVEARRAGRGGPAVLATSIWLPGDVPDPGFPAERERGELRWSIDIAAPAAPIGRRWGDWHFAVSLAAALRRQGQAVEIDHPETRGRATRDADVVLVLRGLERVAPVPGAVNLLWVISHPDDVSDDELAGFDHAFAAGTAWAAAHGVEPLLQCTDATRFHPGVGEPGEDVLFVGNARGGPRPVVLAAEEAGVPVRVIGGHWEQYGITPEADRIANEDLPAAYVTAGVVLNDHHDDMRVQGFVSNRVFDVLAVGGRLLTDDVAGLAEVLDGTSLPVWRDAADLGRLARPPFADFPDDATRLALARHVVRAHSFDARAARLVERARALHSRA